MTATTAVAPLRIGVIGVGRIGRMHAELIARQVPGAALGAVYDAYEPTARDVAAELGVPAATSVQEIFASDLDAVAICSSSDTHVDLLIAAARGGQGGVLREAGVARPGRARPRARRRSTPPGCRSRSASTAASIPPTRRCARRSSPGRSASPHLVRISSRDPEPPPLEYVKTSGGLFLDMMIHDFDMARFVTGSEVVEVFARGAVRVEPSFAEAGDVDTALVTLVHAGRLPDRDRQLAPRRLRLRPAGRGVRLGRDGGVGEPARPHRGRGDRRGRATAAQPVLLPRALPAQLRARVAGVRRGGQDRDRAAGVDQRRAGAAGDRPGRAAVAARGASGARRGGDRR